MYDHQEFYIYALKKIFICNTTPKWFTLICGGPVRAKSFYNLQFSIWFKATMHMWHWHCNVIQNHLLNICKYRICSILSIWLRYLGFYKQICTTFLLGNMWYNHVIENRCIKIGTYMCVVIVWISFSLLGVVNVGLCQPCLESKLPHFPSWLGIYIDWYYGS